MLYRYIVNILNDKCPECAEGSVFLARFKMKEKCDLCDAYFIEKNGIKNIDLLKIDTEGYEFNVLKGLSKYSQNILRRDQTLFFELIYLELLSSLKWFSL